jgi:peptidoglycan hydrolase CwlO-like protein
MNLRPRTAGAFALLAALTATLGWTGTSSGDLQSRISSLRGHEGTLHSGISHDTSRIVGFQGSIDDLQTRLSALQSSLDLQRSVLVTLKTQLRLSRARLVSLQAQLATDKQVLVAQVVAAYEAPQPDITTVILESHGFADLLERVDQMRSVARENARATVRVTDERRAVSIQARQLADLTARQGRATAAVLVQRDEVAQLHLALLDRQLSYIRARNRKSSELSVLSSHRQALERQLSAIQARELAAQNQSFGNVGPLTGGSFSPSGSYGFFQAPGTNYSVGVEPTLAARLNKLGLALHLHLIGISGYRSPQHSVEVGGFANDPHTRGEASDTPGVEGVPESTLNQFGLTRPFPGAAEADHIQLA